MSGFKATAALNKPNVVPVVPDIYMATMIVKQDGKILVRATTPLPENYSLGLSATYTNPFNQPLSSMGGVTAGLLEKGVTAYNGATSFSKWSSGAQWSGGSEMSVEVPFVLQAFNDPAREVVMGMRDLLRLVAPSEGRGGQLFSPGPSMLDGVVSGGFEITIKIGSFFVMTPCIIDSVTEDFDTQMDKNGNPIGAVIRITFKSFYTTTKEDLDKYFSVTTSERWKGGYSRG